MKRLLILLASALLLVPAAGAQEAPKMNKKNLVIKEWNTDPKGNNKVLDHITTSKELVYDHRNRLQTYKKFEFNEFGRKKIQYTYNAKGKLISIKQYEYIAQDGN